MPWRRIYSPKFRRLRAQRHPEDAALTGAALNVDTAAVRFGDRFDDRQPQACAGRRVVLAGAVEALEQARLRLDGDAGTIVDDFDVQQRSLVKTRSVIWLPGGVYLMALSR